MIKQRPDTALQAHGDDAGRTVGCGEPGGLKQMLDRAPGHEDGKRQRDDDQNEPEARLPLIHGAATQSIHNRTMPIDSSAFCAPRWPKQRVSTEGTSATSRGATGLRQTASSAMARRPRPSA